MAVLGIEGTAHTLGVGIVERQGAGCRILANVREMLRPETGGIHPREAAHHHADVGPRALRQALDEAGLAPQELEGVAFSQGPGLGPCLRVAATMARALSVRHGLPLVGVNHCVAHLEIGRGLTAAHDPVLLYASGANTQVIAFARGRYRVFGETLDIGVGNALDKFARDHGIPFPGGPRIEQEAARADPDILHDLPYTVKGMDLGFSGLVTAATRLVTDGTDFAEVCHSLQETAFAGLMEVAERALAHTQKGELVLGGGVACNQRLQDMAHAMAGARGTVAHIPPRPVLVDNGAMIAWNGLLRLEAGDRTPVESSGVLPYQRTEEVEVTWGASPVGGGGPMRAGPAAAEEAGAAIRQGAEAHLVPGNHLDRGVLHKHRAPKAYRHPRLDRRLRDARTRDEAHLLMEARRAGVPVPVVLDIDRVGASLALEPIDGAMLRDVLPHDDEATARRRLAHLGRLVARLHDAGIAHGDLTPSNVLVPSGRGSAPGNGLEADAVDPRPHADAAPPADAIPPPHDLVLIDFGLGRATQEDEPFGVDLHLVEEALAATDARAGPLFAAFLAAYQRHRPDAAAAVRRLEAIRERGRYRGHG